MLLYSDAKTTFSQRQVNVSDWSRLVTTVLVSSAVSAVMSPSQLLTRNVMCPTVIDVLEKTNNKAQSQSGAISV